jgi:transposase
MPGKTQKGHPNYYHGKKVSADKFEEVWNKYRVGGLSVAQAAKALGISHVTFIKWKKELYENQFSIFGVSFIDQSTL